MSDNFWEDIKGVLYDAVNNEFYTEEEREAIIEDGFSEFAGYTDDATTIPLDFSHRQHTFYNPIDLVYWVEDAGIPIEYVFVHHHTSTRNNSRSYNVYVSRSP